MPLLETLKTAKIIRILQRKELAELIGFETRNKYEIRDANGTAIGFAAEQQKGVLGFFFRQYLGHWRTFEIHIFDQSRVPLFIARHPFRWFFQRLEVSEASGRSIGALQQRFAILSKKFDVEDPQRHVVMEVRSPFWKIWTFPFKRQGRDQAVVRKKWSGILKEAFTDSDNFELEFLAHDLTMDERALLLSAGIFIDLKYFEKKAR